MTVQTIHFAQDVGFTQHLAMPLGSTVEQIACASHTQLDDVHAWVRAPAGCAEEWIELPRESWRHVRPKVDGAVMFGYRLHGDWVKSAFAIVASIAISIAVPFIGGLVGGGILGAVVGGLAGAALGIGASLALNALFPSQQAQLTGGYGASAPQEKARQFANVESGSNLLAKESYLPVVIGQRRIAPPEIAQPHYFLEDGQQAINRLFAFDGHHAISDVQVDRAPVSDYANITTEIRDGAETTSVSTFITKVTAPTGISSTLSTFSLDAVTLVDQETPANSEPTWTRFTTVSDSKLEEITIRLQLDSFIKTDSATENVRIPFRFRLRPKGSEGAWINGPEIHFVGRDVSTSLKELRFRWDGIFGDDEPGGAVQYEFFQRVPAAAYTLSDGSTGDQWQADASFVSGSGLRDVANVQGRRNGIRFTLDPAVFPQIEYEWEVIRGIAVSRGALTSSTYVLDGAVNSLFLARSVSASWQVPIDQGSYVGRITVQQATAIVNRQPCQRPSVALIALKAKGQSVRNVTAMASRYVMDWDGEGWNTLTTTVNPATHYRQVLYDYLVYHGIDTSLIVEDQFVAWRQECIDRGYEVSAVFAGSSVKEVLEGIATAGYARPRVSDQYGIDWFRDRSADRPVQTFSPRNASIKLEWVMGEKPVGIRANFQNADRDFADDEIQINNPFYSNFVGYEVRTYATIAKPALVERRAVFDLLQSYYQGRRAIFVDCAIEGLICERGDLVGIVTDLMDDAHSGARIRKVIDSTTFTYDQEIPTESTTSLFGIPNIFEPDNIFTVGEQSAVLVSTPTGTEMRTVVAAEQTPDGWTIRVDAPFSSTDLVGGHFVIGPVSRFLTRCIVSEVNRQGEERAQLVLVDEAPEIYATLYPPQPVRPSWAPEGAFAAYNAVTGQSYQASVDFTRDSVAWWNPAGSYLDYEVDELRRHDAAGMILEVDRTNINAVFESASWSASMHTAVAAGTTAGPVAGGVGKTISGFLGGTSYASLAITQALSPGQTWTGSAWLRTSGANIGKNARLRVARGAGGAFEQSLSGPLVITGEWQRFSITHTFVANHTSIRLDVMGDSSDTVSALEVYGAQIEMGAARTTPIVTTGSAATRAADALVFLPAPSIGTYDLHVRYDNDSEAVLLSGVSGDQSISPSTLARPVVKLLWASGAA